MSAAMVMTTAVVLVVLLLLLLLVLGCARITRNWPTPPERDSELASTTPLDSGPPMVFHADTHPGVGHVPWVNTVPSGQMPLDETPPWDQAVQTMNAKERKP